MDIKKLTEELTRDEGSKLFPYKDTKGVLTIGVGRNLEANGISKEEAEFLLQNDIRIVEMALDRTLPWWRSMGEVRQRVLANMTFNMGIGTMLKFHNTLAAMEDGDWVRAVAGMKNSLWAQQVGARADRLIKMMLEG